MSSRLASIMYQTSVEIQKSFNIVSAQQLSQVSYVLYIFQPRYNNNNKLKTEKDREVDSRGKTKV